MTCFIRNKAKRLAKYVIDDFIFTSLFGKVVTIIHELRTIQATIEVSQLNSWLPFYSTINADRMDPPNGTGVNARSMQQAHPWFDSQIEYPHILHNGGCFPCAV